ncbi:MAG: SWIM zinc finger family protein, partial [Acidimicrobiia bacterium]
MGLIDVFDLQAVKALAQPRIYERGVRYHAEGRVEPEAGSTERLRATVRGTVPYTVELWVDRGNPAWSCSCPYAEDGAFCKHCVAVGLLVASGPDPIGVVVVRPDEPAIGDDVAGHVEALSRERLVEIVLDQCENDWRLRERMVAEAQVVRGDGPDTNMWRRRIDSAFAPMRGFVDYSEAGEWAVGVFDVIDGLADLLEGGQADAVIELTEHAHRRADAAIQYVDDSDGWLTQI